MKQTEIDSMKYRKSTHLAGVDIETMIAESGKCVVTIKEAYYDTNVDVSGNKTSGYFLVFNEPIKPMVVNSGNRKTIGTIVKSLKQLSPTESRFLPNWIGVKIELTFDPTVKMMGQVVGGIKVVQPEVIEISDVEALAKLNACTNKDELAAAWKTLSKEDRKLSTVLAVMDEFKTKFA